MRECYINRVNLINNQQDPRIGISLMAPVMKPDSDKNDSRFCQYFNLKPSAFSGHTMTTGMLFQSEMLQEKMSV